MRVIGNSVAAAYDRSIPQLIGESDTRRKKLLAVSDSIVFRDVSPPADQNIVSGGIIGFDAQSGGARAVGIEFPSQSQVQRQFGSRLPSVAHIETIHVLLAIHLDKLAALPRPGGRAEQKCGQTIPTVFKGR